MLEFIEIPHGTIFPHACVACTGTAGPMLDTHRELHGYGRVYVCAACVKRLAVVNGIVSGKDADVLADALKRAASAERDLAVSERGRHDYEEEGRRRGRKIDELEETVAQQRGRIDQLEGAIAENAAAAVALVSHD